jgi:hypothetical protein
MTKFKAYDWEKEKVGKMSQDLSTFTTVKKCKEGSSKQSQMISNFGSCSAIRHKHGKINNLCSLSLKMTCSHKLTLMS